MPPSVRYYNQTAPFWDFIASMEDQSHPFFAANRGNNSNENTSERPNPWDFQGVFGPGFPFNQPQHQRGPPGPPPPPEHHDPEEGPSHPSGPPPPPPFAEEPRGGSHHGPHRRGPGHQHGEHESRRGRCGGRGGFGGRGRGRHGADFQMGNPFLNNLAEMFQSQLFGDENENENTNTNNANPTNPTTTTKETEDFKPEVDIFDTPDAYIVHASLPGAKKEDVGVAWDAEKSELSIAGVIYRPGDEEMLKALALDERKVGAFERKVRLGSRANPAQVDVDGITAKMEDGVLRVEVPKMDSGYVEIKKVDIE